MGVGKAPPGGQRLPGSEGTVLANPAKGVQVAETICEGRKESESRQ